MDILIKIAQLFLCFTILVGIHELGHFLMARAFKIRVEKFYIFFDPWFSLFKFKRGDTEYGLGWLPLGGYVKIAGMIDESMANRTVYFNPARRHCATVKANHPKNKKRTKGENGSGKTIRTKASCA